MARDIDGVFVVTQGFAAWRRLDSLLWAMVPLPFHAVQAQHRPPASHSGHSLPRHELTSINPRV